jgi:hypothetical protein
MQLAAGSLALAAGIQNHRRMLIRTDMYVHYGNVNANVIVIAIETETRTWNSHSQELCQLNLNTTE